MCSAGVFVRKEKMVCLKGRAGTYLYTTGSVLWLLYYLHSSRQIGWCVLDEQIEQNKERNYEERAGII